MATMDTGETAFVIFISIWLVESVSGNMFILLVMWRNRKLWNLTNLLICNLAIGDIILAAIVLPQHVHDISHTEDYHEAEINCRLVNSLPVWCISSSIYSMVVMSIERYRAIVLQSVMTLSPKLCVKIIAGIWVAATILMLPTVLEFSKHEVTKDNITILVCQAGDFPHEYSIVNGLLLLIVSYLFPQVLLYFHYGKLLVFVWKRSRTSRSADNATDANATSLNTSAVSKSKVKILKMLFAITALFALSWMPYFILMTIAKISGTHMSSHANNYSTLIQLTLAVFSTSYNLVLYILFMPAFRKTAVRLVCRRSANAVAPSEANQSQPGTHVNSS